MPGLYLNKDTDISPTSGFSQRPLPVRFSDVDPDYEPSSSVAERTKPGQRQTIEEKSYSEWNPVSEIGAQRQSSDGGLILYVYSLSLYESRRYCRRHRQRQRIRMPPYPSFETHLTYAAPTRCATTSLQDVCLTPTCEDYC